MSTPCLDLIVPNPQTQERPIGFPAFHFLGIRLHAMSGPDLVRAVGEAVDASDQYVIANHNLHSLYLCESAPKMRDFYASAKYIHIDGMPIVWLGQLFGHPLKREHRTGYISLLPLLAKEAAMRGWRIFYLGSRPGVAEKAACKLRSAYPGLQIKTQHGYFQTDPTGPENQDIVATIRDYAPQILMVGMSMPRQEMWIQENLPDICANAIFCCGALMDYVSGELPTAPRWLGPLGLEWIFRFTSDPVQTWRRYLLEPWTILFRVARHYLRTHSSGFRRSGTQNT